MEHGDAIRMVQDLRGILDDKDRELESRGRQLVRKDALILKMKDRDLRRREERRQLQEELRRAKNNIGELNSMIVRLERTLESVRRAHENQAKTIAEQGNTIHALNLEKASLEGLNNDLVGESRELRRKQELAEGAVDVDKVRLRRELGTANRQIDEWREAHQAALRQACGLQDQVDELLGRVAELEEDERCDCAPSLALVACKKKLEQLEGMLENQRRSTRELGASLQVARDEKAAAMVDVIQLRGQLDKRQKELDAANRLSREHQTQRDELYQRVVTAETRAQTMEAQRNEKIPVNRLVQVLRERDQYLKDLQDLQRRVNRAKSILAPTVTMDTSEGSITWEPGTFVRGPAKKAVPRNPNAWTCGRFHQGHNCDLTYHHGPSDGHHCHCGQWWGGK